MALSSHKVRTADGGAVELPRYGRQLAIRAMCSECMGWESHPKDCTATLCPLYPFRGKTLRTRKGSKPPLKRTESPLFALAGNSEGDDSRKEGFEHV